MAIEYESSLLKELHWRGFLEAITSDDLDAHLCESRRMIYAGFDPTADSLHIGNLVPVMALAHVQRQGHVPLVMVGGGTGLIGDPSGKAAERKLMTPEEAGSNAEAVRKQLTNFFDLSSQDKGQMLDNAEWLTPLNLISFFRDIGKHFSVNEMMKRDSVQRRLEERDQGISYTEFSYMLLQAYDFLHLFQNHACTIQLGGSDQWGNILSGMELIRRVTGQRGHGITHPLLTTSSGGKFGKTEDGAVWLDARRTSPYQMYQYWLQTADADVVRYLKLFTFLEQSRILELESEVQARPDQREAQRVLAAECTSIIHGVDTARTVQAASRILFSPSEEIPTAEAIAVLAREMPATVISRAEFDSPIGLVDLLLRTNLAESKASARKLIEGGGVYLNNVRQEQPQKAISMVDSKWPGAIMLRVGKKNHHLVQIL
jgi:tyrosyl-tRNA synthetase